jgi:plastocyanin
VLVIALFVMIVELGQVRGRVDSLETAGAPAPAAATQDPLGSPQTFKIALKEMEVVPKFVEVTAGTPVTLNVVNEGAIPHNLAIGGGPKTPDLKPGGTATLDLGTVTKALTGECSIPGHKDAGMTFEVRVSGSAPAAAAAAADHTDASLDDSAKLDPNATPPAAWQPYDPKLAPAPGGREHKLTMTATEGVVEVAPGVKQQMWSFNGKVPGPAVRGRVGDLFTITLVNDKRNKLGHSIDFHASKVAWNDEMRTINPGEQLVYQFEAKHAGVYMYHCGTAPTLHHIGNGMYGRSSSTRRRSGRSTTSTCWSSPSCTSGRRASPGRCARCRTRAWTRWCSTATPPSTSSGRSGSSRTSGCGSGCWTPGRRRTAPSTSSGPSSTPPTRRAPTCCDPAPAGAAPRCWTCSPPRAASWSSPSTSPACTRS